MSNNTSAKNINNGKNCKFSTAKIILKTEKDKNVKSVATKSLFTNITANDTTRNKNKSRYNVTTIALAPLIVCTLTLL